ncbi:MAG: ankyrin repeat domain-containing protein, partial [Proteobacteria bacterium]
MALSLQHRAALEGDADACAAIPLEHLDDADARGLCCLHLASLAGHEAIVRVLLERGASLAPETTVVLSPVSRLDRDRAKNLGLPRTADDLGDCPLVDRGATALHLACARGHAGVVACLLAAGGDPAAPTTFGATPLHLAARAGSLSCVQRLLERGVTVDATLSSQAVPGFYDAGVTALHAAAERGALDVVDALLEAGADATLRTRTGCGALFFAARSARADVVRRLVEAGAVVGAPRAAHDDPLREAILRNAEDCIAPLLAAGASAQGVFAAEESRHRAPVLLLAPPLAAAIRLRRVG